MRALDDVSLQIPRGVIFGLLGPNGAGKTTFVKLLLSAVQPTHGGALIFGRDAREPEARRPVGYLPENHRFPTYFTGSAMLDFYASLSGLDRRARNQRMPELLELVGLADWGRVRLNKYSKGMLQRLGLAQALMHSPSLLILDEPTDGVDPVGRRQIREILLDCEQRGVTIFINSHLLAEVETFCSQVAILHAGRVALTGKVSDLTTGKGYRLAARQVPESLAQEIKATALATEATNGVIEFRFPDRKSANEALDLLRSQRCEIELFAPTTSTLEDVFLDAVRK